MNSLNWLDQTRSRLDIAQPLRALQIAEGGLAKSCHQRPQSLMIFRLGSGCRGPQRTAMKTTGKSNDFVAIRRCVQPREFQGRFVRLGTGITEKRLTAKGSLRKQLCPVALQCCVAGVRHMNQFLHLLPDGLDHGGRAVAQQVATPTGK